ncbi:hypothetical protein VNO77_05527 [Canavalia gladiata]|uniref:F-box protein At3g26010-like beta-propeller domain-containing protein n=1 Tax=Canavalia gladiata TaxID=3824 RepID=A0AAN9N0K2_CANGL
MKDHQHHEKQYYFNFLSTRNLLIIFPPTNTIHLSNLQIQTLLSPTPQFDNPDDVTKKDILGCSNGLLLSRQNRVYSVTNPITKNRLQLASLPPFTSQNRRDRALEGFVCEPYYRVEGNTNRVIINLDPPRFKVVRVPYFDGTANQFLYGVTKYEFEVVAFSSETGQWSTKMVSCPKGFTQINLWEPAVAHEGKLYFMGKTNVAVYDPFNNEERCDTIDYPINLYQRGVPGRCHVGVCCGKIRICALCLATTTPTGPVETRISVWELEHNLGWRLVHSTYLPRVRMKECIRPELGRVRAVDLVGTGTHVRGFHPLHGDVVFFQYFHRIFVGNLKTNQFETVGYGIHSLQSISFHQPCWPTPLSSIL